MSGETILTWMSIAGGGWAAARYVVRPCRAAVIKVRSGLGKLDQISAELGDNGGKSLKDLVRQTHGMTQINDARMDLVIDLLDRPLFECAPNGDNVRINEAFTRAFGWAPADLLAQRWISVLHPEDRDQYVREWRHAVRDRRAFESRARYLTRAGVVLEVRVFAQPNFDASTGDILRWLGRVDTVAINREPLDRRAS